MRVLLGSDVRAVLPAVRMPTLVLHCADDPVLPPIAGRYIAEKVPNATYVEIDGVDDVWWAGNADAALEEIEEFLTGSRGSAEVDRVLATVLFTDIVASTDQLTEVGDRRWRDVLDTYEGLARRQLDRFAGRSIKSTGDGVLATFDGPARASAPRRAIRDVARQMGLESRAGIHAGEIELRGDDVAGITVHVAARVCAIGGPNDVLATRTIRDLTAGSGLIFTDRGEHTLKGIDESWKLYSVTT